MDRKLKALYLADVGAITLFLFGSSINHTPTIWLSIATGLPLSSYLCAKVPTRKELEDKRNQQLMELQSQLSQALSEKSWLEQLNASQAQKLLDERSQVEGQLRDRVAELTSQIEEIRSNHLRELAEIEVDSSEERGKHEENYRLEVARKQAEITRITQQYESQIQHLKLEYDEAVAAAKAQIENLVSTANQVKAYAQKQVTEAETQKQQNAEVEKQLLCFKEQLKLANEELRVRRSSAQLKYERNEFELNRRLDDVKAENLGLNTVCRRLQAEIEELKQQNQQLFDELYGAKNSLVSDELVNQIQSLLAQHELKTEFISRENRGGVDFIYLKPETLWKQSTLDTVAQVLPGLVDIPQPEISAKKGRIEVRIDNRSMLDKISDAPANWLEKLYFDAVTSSKNLAILGARGGGKTELAKNYIGLVLSHEPDAEVIYIQPKVDDYAVFEVSGRLIEPQYIGFQPVTSSEGKHFPSAYDGILYLRDLYTKRNSINQQHFADSKPSPKFQKVFFLVDELQVAISREREFIDPEIIKAESLRNGQTYCGKIIRDAISLGRSLGIVVLALGQLPNVSVYGWTKHDLYQYIVLFMAANAPQALDYSPTKEEKKRIESELDLWRKRASRDAKKSFYCYVRPMDKAGYLALLPDPGKYLDRADGEEKVTTNARALKPLTGEEDGLDGRTDGTQKQGSNELTQADGIPSQSDRTDEDRLLEIRNFKATGETRLRIIIPAVWSDIKGVEVIDSRAYKKARNEYKRLTGE